MASTTRQRQRERHGQPPAAVRRNFNEAAHKLGYWPVTPVKAIERTGRSRSQAADDDRDVVAHASKVVLALGALGVVYGDLGTSPLYTEQFIFTRTRTPRAPQWPGSTGSRR